MSTLHEEQHDDTDDDSSVTQNVTQSVTQNQVTLHHATDDYVSSDITSVTKSEAVASHNQNDLETQPSQVMKKHLL